MIAPFVRIALRILAGYMIGRGVNADLADSLWTDEALIAAISLGISEGWYFIARKYDWAT